ncbi:hypothetical protein T05_15313 [Trichinella murrelli]|uniref:Uncharacterized protein n=1 Tax=Trichinella murrelli TaxID=144512 RepID=A0A0V0TM18_9BILA|nr:hypothetical protein T05_15313 [Trichinella murrelli]
MLARLIEILAMCFCLLFDVKFGIYLIIVCVESVGVNKLPSSQVCKQGALSSVVVQAAFVFSAVLHAVSSHLLTSCNDSLTSTVLKFKNLYPDFNRTNCIYEFDQTYDNLI